MLLLALSCSENKLHNLDSEVPAANDTVLLEDTELPEDTEPAEDTEVDPCEGAPEEESACDGLDEDCDGIVDEGEGLSDCTSYWPDADRDELGTGEPICTCSRPEGYAEAPGDCDDDDVERQVCTSCLDILTKGLGSSDGAYTIDPDGDGSFEVFCDMSTDGGGWTQALSLNAMGMTHYDAGTIFESKTSFGVHTDDNALSPAFYRLSFTSSYLVDETHGVPVMSQAAWTGGTVGEQIDTLNAGTHGGASVWSRSPRTSLQLRNSETTDAVFKDGDLRVHLLLNAAATTDIAFPVSLEYLPDERHLVFDSDFHYAGARIYTDEPYDVADYGVDERLRLFLR